MEWRRSEHAQVELPFDSVLKRVFVQNLSCENENENENEPVFHIWFRTKTRFHTEAWLELCRIMLVK